MAIRLRWFIVLGSIIALAGFILWSPASGSNPTVREIQINASEFAYSPGRIEVNQGDHIVFTLTASDVVHGFALDGYGLDTRVVPGLSNTVEVVATHSGKFRFRCSISCGALHPFMIGELVVTPNNPFWKSAAALLIGMAGMFAYLWVYGKEMI